MIAATVRPDAFTCRAFEIHRTAIRDRYAIQSIVLFKEETAAGPEARDRTEGRCCRELRVGMISASVGRIFIQMVGYLSSVGGSEALRALPALQRNNAIAADTTASWMWCKAGWGIGLDSTANLTDHTLCLKSMTLPLGKSAR